MSHRIKRAMIFLLMAVCISSTAFAVFLGRTPAHAHAVASQTSTALSVYIGSNDGYLYTLDANTGSLKWRYNTGSPVSYRSAVSGGVVYTPSADAIDALNASDGSLLWSYTTTGTAFAPSVNSGVVYFNSQDGFLYALNASDGSLLWHSSVGSNSSAYKPAIVNGVVYDSASGQLFAFHASDGSLIWHDYDYQIDGPTTTAPTVSNGVVYVGTESCFNAVKASDGSRILGRCSGPIYSTPTTANGLVYYGFLGCCNQFVALSISNPAAGWSYTTRGPDFSQAAVRSGVVYVGAGKAVYALDAITGTKHWARFLGSTIGTAGTVAAANGLVYVGASNGTLYTLSQSSSTGRIVWSYITGGSILTPPTIA